MNKILMVAVATAALAFGLYMNRTHWDDLVQATTSANHPLAGQSYPTVEGQAVNLQQYAGKVVVVNFWATWCPPCVEEMPELNALYVEELKSDNIEMVGIAVDSPSNVKEFLAKTPVDYPIVLAGFGGTELAKSLGNTQGGLPFTVVLDEKGKVLLTKAGRIEMQTIRDTLKL